MKKVGVLLRVYNRIEDLKYCIDIIRDTWELNNYYIIVVANGREDGYIIDEGSINKIDRLIEIKNNIGHFTGNSQLLLKGLPLIPDECDYTIILEADTWLYSDRLIAKYISRLTDEEAVWASAQFFSYSLNLATDFAIVNTSFVKKHQEVFTFNITPEYYVAKFLKDNGFKSIYIKENMPVNLPRYIRKYPFAPTGRFFVFPKGKMVTHHIESLKDGMNEKKFCFNMIAGKDYFELPYKRQLSSTRFLLKFFMKLSYVFPYKSWFINK